MIDLQAIFKNKRLDEGKLPLYGFILRENCYEKEVPIMQGQFSVKITVTTDGAIDYRVYDTLTAEEYVLARIPDATGTFIGEVHAACEEVLSDIAQKCFHTEYFQNAQTQRILRYMKERYGFWVFFELKLFDLRSWCFAWRYSKRTVRPVTAGSATAAAAVAAAAKESVFKTERPRFFPPPVCCTE